MKDNEGGRIIVSDNEIIELFWSRSEEAITETDKKYRKECMKISHNILNNTSDCEECLNDTYMTAWNIIPPNRPNYLCAFICKIMRNHSLRKYEYYHREKRKNHISQSLDELNECIPDKCSTEDIADKNELAKEIQNFLMAQNIEKRVIFIRRYWFYDSFEQISEKCGISEDNVKMTLTRLRKNLRQFLTERGFTY